MGRTAAITILVAALGCGGMPSSDTSSGETGGDTESDTESDGGDTESDTGDETDCSQYGDADSCEAAGCTFGVNAMRTEVAVDVGACEFTHGPDECFELGEVDDQPRTYYRVRDGEVRIATTLAECGAEGQYTGWIERGPAGAWQPCDGSEADPPECACYCPAGQCRWDTGRAVLDGCSFVELCAGVGEGDLAACFHQALVDGQTGFVDVDVQSDDYFALGRIYLLGNATAWIDMQLGCVNGPCCWDEPRLRLCDTDAAAFEATCVAEPWLCWTDAPSYTWISNCLAPEPSCP